MGVDSLIALTLKAVGINPERYSLQWASAAEAPRFVKLITEFTKQAKQLGPLGVAEGIDPVELKKRLAKALEVMSDRKVRMAFATATKGLRKEGTPSQERIDEVIAEKMEKSLSAAFAAESTDDSGKSAPPEKKAPAKEETAAEKKEAGADKKAAPAKKKGAKKK